MCGIVGFLGGRQFAAEGHANAILEQMANKISHRGPDNFGIWSERGSRIGLGHRRLSILDLSEAGAQPMASKSGHLKLVFNGEIYNHLELREQLNTSWDGHSDTETLLMGFQVWGIPETLRKCSGMFAFALWDKVEQKLTLGRDRMGEKPLYYGWFGEGDDATFVFGSELKSFKEHPNVQFNLDRNSIALYLRHTCIPSPYSIYEEVSKLPPATTLSISIDDRTKSPEEYWSIEEAIQRGKAAPFSGDFEACSLELEYRLMQSVKNQMISDVPIGAFLSGGIDSSTIVALMQKQSSKPVKTFTIGFNEEQFDEARYASAVAKHLKTDHTELYVSSEEAQSVIPQLPSIYDEPFADSSQIPTYLVSKLARSQVTVSLSGDAGDELFGGYNRYTMVDNLWNKLEKVPRPLRSLLSGSLKQLSPSTWDIIAKTLNYKKHQHFGEKIHKIAAALPSRDLKDLYTSFVSTWDNPAEIVLGATEHPTLLTHNLGTIADLDHAEKMMYLDAKSYLPDDILTKVDRAAMATSLETRIPMLDADIVEFAWTLPMGFKIRNGKSKAILRHILNRHVPTQLVERPKMGFGVPIDRWLRGPMREWADDLLSEHRLKSDSVFDVKKVTKRWAEHKSGKYNWQHSIWAILMFQAWLESNK
jgi:asparagine synthase (glutamine-hydrolysing)